MIMPPQTRQRTLEKMTFLNLPAVLRLNIYDYPFQSAVFQDRTYLSGKTDMKKVQLYRRPERRYGDRDSDNKS